MICNTLGDDGFACGDRGTKDYDPSWLEAASHDRGLGRGDASESLV